MFDTELGDELISQVTNDCYAIINDEATCVDINVRNWFACHGYKIYAGEKDSFGWLSACIEKEGTNKVLVFG